MENRHFGGKSGLTVLSANEVKWGVMGKKDCIIITKSTEDRLEN